MGGVCICGCFFCVYVYWRFWTECLVQCGVLLYSCEMPAYPVMIRECRVITGAASASSQGHLWLPSLTKAKLPGLPSTFIRTPHQSPLSLLSLILCSSQQFFPSYLAHISHSSFPSLYFFLLHQIFPLGLSSFLSYPISYSFDLSIAGVFNVLNCGPPHKHAIIYTWKVITADQIYLFSLSVIKCITQVYLILKKVYGNSYLNVSP